ncbi:hypothetical protein COOONC_18283 [Cooperia oncophora]
MMIVPVLWSAVLKYSILKDSPAMCNGLPEETHDPAEVIERKQHALIKSLMNLTSTLDNLLTEMGKSSSVGTNEKGKNKSIIDIPISSEKPEVSAKDDSRKDKEAKKEARKAAKAEAKSKVASAPSSTAKSTALAASDRQWTVNEDKRTSETGQSLTACLPQTFTNFGSQGRVTRFVLEFLKVRKFRKLTVINLELGEIDLTFTVDDQPWVEALSRLSSKRNIAFKGAVVNDCKDPLTIVNSSLGEKFSVVSSCGTLNCRVTSWKLFGAALGIFSFAPNHSIQAAHQHRWLLKVESVLAGKSTKEDVVREASQFLSQFDALGSQFNFGIADICVDWGLQLSSAKQCRAVDEETEFSHVKLRSFCAFQLLHAAVLHIRSSPKRYQAWEIEMPFMHGTMPLRRTFYYLLQGKIKFRDDVQVFAMGFHRQPNEEQRGAREFVFWHWAQLQYKNPRVQLVKHIDTVITPFARAYLKDGREVLFDLEGMNREEIESRIATTLGKTELVMKREDLMEIAKLNPADFGSKCKRQCMCEVQGQHPCTALLQAPKYMTGKWRWNHNLI